MKLDAKQVRMVAPFLPWPGRRRLRFIGRRNSVQLLETALVIEGYRQRLYFPILDVLFRQALSERTLVTVPYSRIIGFRLKSLWLVRLLVVLLIWLPALVYLISLLFPVILSARLADFSEIVGSLCLATVGGVLAIVITVLAVARLGPRHMLRFRGADGVLVIVGFRISSRKLRRSFAERLEENRRSATEFADQTGAGQ